MARESVSTTQNRYQGLVAKSNAKEGNTKLEYVEWELNQMFAFKNAKKINLEPSKIQK